jgi:hypothetical protein
MPPLRSSANGDERLKFPDQEPCPQGYVYCRNRRSEERTVGLGTILLIILIVLLIGALPTWPYSGAWGYYPSGGLGLILLIVLILVLLGRV